MFQLHFAGCMVTYALLPVVTSACVPGNEAFARELWYVHSLWWCLGLLDIMLCIYLQQRDSLFSTVWTRHRHQLSPVLRPSTPPVFNHLQYAKTCTTFSSWTILCYQNKQTIHSQLKPALYCVWCNPRLCLAINCVYMHEGLSNCLLHLSVQEICSQLMCLETSCSVNISILGCPHTWCKSRWFFSPLFHPFPLRLHPFCLRLPPFCLRLDVSSFVNVCIW